MLGPASPAPHTDYTTMGCARGLCTAEKIFIFINIAFAMYSGALLATAARLAWDPSTYTWFRFLCSAQYRVSAAYVLVAGLWLAALVYLAAASSRARPAPLHAYCAGVVCLALSEVGYGAWMCASLAAWWRDSPQAELARHGMDLMHDIKPALLAMERFKDVTRPIYEMIEEMERAAPNNAFVIIIFGVVGMVLQVGAFVMARRLARRSAGSLSLGDEAALEPCGDVTCGASCGGKERGGGGGEGAADDDSDAPGHEPHSPGWRKKANLRMYTILDKIF